MRAVSSCCEPLHERPQHLMDTLATLLEQAESQRNIALAAFNQARARRDEARAQAQDLEAYRNDYSARWHHQFQRGGAASAAKLKGQRLKAKKKTKTEAPRHRRASRLLRLGTWSVELPLSCEL